MTFDTYLTLVPRGLHFTVKEMLLQQLIRGEPPAFCDNNKHKNGTTVSLTSYQAEITILGDDNHHSFHNSSPQQQQQLVDSAAAAADGNEEDEEQRYLKHLTQQLRKKSSDGKGQRHKRCRQECVIPSTCILPVGTIIESPTATTTDTTTANTADSNTASLPQQQQHPQREVSIGYAQDGKQAIWSLAGNLQGLVWIKIQTNAPPTVMASLRCIAPLLALVHFQEFTTDTSNHRRRCTSSNSSCSIGSVTGSINGNHGGDNSINNNNNIDASVINDFDETKSLDYVVKKLKEMVALPQFDMTDALDLWSRHVRDCWNDDDANNNVQHDHNVSSSEIIARQQPQKTADCDKKKKTKKKLLYRLSCMRTDSKSYSYTRQELLTKVASFLGPPPSTTPSESGDDDDESNDDSSGGEHDDDDDVWKVDLKNYNLEVVLLMRAQFVAVGLALRPYQRLGTACFGAGKCPPDVSPPYLTRGEMSGLVRLRPSTAQVLLHLAQVQISDVLLDPCAGIGTIPMETMFLPTCPIQPALALGGDLVLGPNGMASLATTYEKEARRVAADLASAAANLLAWDASHLPIRSGSVDAIVSDLPFGHSCLSAKKMSQLLPLLMSELSRVLRPGSGRMVLLCGYYLPILEELIRINESSTNNIIASHTHNNTKDTADTTTKSSAAATTATSALPPIWILPCQAVFPVNIGGHLAWVIQVRRGMGTASRISHQVDRVRKMALIRERNTQCKAMDDSNKTNTHSKKGKKNRVQS